MNNGALITLFFESDLSLAYFTYAETRLQPATILSFWRQKIPNAQRGNISTVLGNKV
jgi:hypothetical protein